MKVKHHIYKVFYFVFLALIVGTSALAQPSGNCSPNTPFFNVNLSSTPNGTWTSTPLPRVGNCCGTLPPDKCVEFKITLAPTAVAINFQIASGAVPPGALFYQINCGPPVAVGSPICLNGPGPYSLTFCKPGNNINTYAITSIAAPEVSPDDSVADGCATTMYASGLLVNSSITWNSVYPGTYGAYNSYLSCTVGCDSTVVTAQPNAPPFVDYVVCGQPVAGACVSSGLFCDTIRIHFSPPILNTISPNPAVFCANNPGGIILTGNINGGMPPYTYAWTNGPNGSGTVVGNSLTYTATTGGNYSLIVYDQNYPTCPPKISNVSVSVTPNPTVNAGPDQTLCATSVNLNGSFAGSTGCIWSGGNGTFSPNNTTPNAIYTPSSGELQSGTIVLTLSSTGNGVCGVVSDQVIIHIAPPIAVAVTSPSFVCFGQTANVSTIVTGGFTPYTYAWSNGSNNANLFNVNAGTYSLSVNSTSGAGCTTSTVISIALNPSITVNTSPNNSISCGTFAVVSATATGGTGFLSYNWSNGASGNTTNVYSGTYVITVTDALGCTGTNTVSVLSSNSALVSSINQPPTLCYGGSATLSVSATGGFGGYTYQWSNGSTAPSISVGVGNYCCQVTDGGGCISSSCVNVVQSTSITIYIPNPPTICYGASTTANAFVSGGQPPYNYSWSNGQFGASMTGGAGSYALTVTDALGCVATKTVAINQSSPLSAVANATATSCFGSVDGKASVNVVGGTAPYYYSWSPYGGSNSSAAGLSSGNFNITITDAIGCVITASINVPQPAPLTVTANINNHVSCYGGTNGSAIAVPNGGNSGYTYQWLPGGSNVQSPNNLIAGNYIVTVTDSKGCFQTAPITITQPSVLSSSLIGVTNNNCYGASLGSATVTGIGGTIPYSYQWVPGGASSSIANNLSAGVYTVTITDANFCTTQHTVSITQPTSLTASLSVINNVSCNGGSNGAAIVNTAGGTAPYYYSWSTAPTQTTQSVNNLTAGSYSVVVTDSKNCSVTTPAITISQPSVLTASTAASSVLSCSTAITLSATASGGGGSYTYTWSTGSHTQNISVYSGTYTVAISDNLGCIAVSTIAVQSPSNALTASIPQPPSICNGSSVSVTVNASGGFGSYTYLWSNSSTAQSNIVQAGQHCVNVTDAGGCITSACVNVIQNLPIAIQLNQQSVVCPLGTSLLTPTVSGGQAPYSYLWSNGLTTPTINAAVGNYTLTVFDVNGSTCFSKKTATVVEEPPINIFTGTTNVSCNGGNNGTASIYVNGGVPGYSYLWSVGGVTTSIIGGLSAGTYSVLVTDNIGCTKPANVSISQPSTPIQAITTTTDITCNGATNGIVSAAGSGGVGSAYYYYWAPISNSNQIVSGLPAGTYSVIVADSSGCYTNAIADVTEPPLITISTVTIASTCGYSNGSATVTPSGGGGVYTYTWVPTGGNNSLISNVAANTYTVRIRDNFNCVRQFPVVIPSRLSTASAGFSVSPACPGTSSFFTDLSVNGNDSIVSWSWDFGDPLSGGTNFSLVQNPSHIYTIGGSYSPTLTIQTAIGCISSFSLGVPFYPRPNTDFMLNNICANSSISFTNTSSISPGSITNYNWNFGDVASGANNSSTVLNPVHFYSTAGNYTISLTATSNNSCTSTNTHSITVYSLPAVSFTASNVCSNNPNLFTNLSGGGFVKWFWNFGDGSPLDSLTISPMHTYTASGSYSVVLTNVSGQNCRNSDTFNIVVFPGPVVNFNAPSACLNKPTAFTDLTSTATGSIVSWSWDFGDFAPLSNAQNPSHTYAVSGVFNAVLTASASNGCSASTTKTVSVFPLPVADFSTSNACLNATTNFTDLSTPGAGSSIVSWIWAFGDGSPVSNIQNPTHVYNLTGAYSPTLVVSNSFGCKDTTTEVVTIYPVPTIAFNILDTSGCEELCTYFVASSNPTDLIANWQWNFGDNSVTGTTASLSHCYGDVGTYSVTLVGTTANGCVATASQTSAVHINPKPEADFIYTPTNPTTAAPSVYYTNTSQNITGFVWYFDDNTMNSLDNNPIHIYETAGEHCAILEVFNQYGCSDRKLACVVIDQDFTFYVPNAFTPNSTTGVNDTFTGAGTNIDKFEMWIYDRWGEFIYHTNDIKQGWDGKAKEGKSTAKQEVYVYKIEVTDFRGDVHKYVGHVTLLR